MSTLKHRTLTLVAVFAVAAAGCAGKDGAAGAAGQNGSNGAPGTPGSGGSDGAPGSNGTNGTNGVNGGVSTGLKVNVTGTTVNSDNTVSVRFTLKDDQGFPVDATGVNSLNTRISPRFAIAAVTTASDGSMLPYTVLTKSGGNPTAMAAPAVGAAATSNGQLTQNAVGDYTYKFPPSAALATLSNTYCIWIEASRQTNLGNADDPKTFTAVNKEYNFIPSGSGTPAKREIVLAANCNKCHAGFKPEGLVRNAFHSGARNTGVYCNVCHNQARTSTPTNSDGTTAAAASSVFVHRIHNSENLQPANIFDNVSGVTYPQDIRNCDGCHGGAAQGDQWKTRPSRAACGSCHDYVDFSGVAPACTIPLTRDSSGLPVPCSHRGGQQTDDTGCAGCHTSALITNMHLTLAPPDPSNIYIPITDNSTAKTGNQITGTACTSGAPCTCTTANPCIGDATAKFVPKTTGTATSGNAGVACTATSPCTCTPTNPCISGNNNTNAAFLGAAGQVPAGAKQITYVVDSVSAFTDGSNVKRPRIVFKLQQSVNGGTPTDVVFNTFGSGKTELIDGFVGSPSVYFAFAVGQDGVQPADFNATASAYIKGVWNGSASGTAMTGPDANGFYTITLTGSTIPDTATMLTGGVGYTYGLQSTQPLTQTDVPGYPYNTYNGATVYGVGGVLVPAPDVWKVATGYTGRRTIVDNAKCKNCHVALGANPTFHAGQRNDGPTCSFCHTTNQSNGGWSGNVKDFIHALHAGDHRSTQWGWHAESASAGFWDVKFPGQLNYCESCHATLTGNDASTHTYDFSATVSTSNGHGFDVAPVYSDALMASLLWSTDAANSVTVPTFGSPGGPASYNLSAYVDPTVAYGLPFATSNFKNADGSTFRACSVTSPCQADSTTLVTSPITAACVACHDTPADRAHMIGNGGSFYVARSAATAVEQCLICHGPQPGAIMPIADAHR